MFAIRVHEHAHFFLNSHVPTLARTLPRPLEQHRADHAHATTSRPGLVVGRRGPADKALTRRAVWVDYLVTPSAGEAMSARRRRPSGGFSLVEVLLVIGMVSVVAGITLYAFHAALRQYRGDANLRLIVWQLQVARELALGQRRSIEVQLVEPNEIRTLRHEIPAGETLLSRVFFEGNVRFTLYPGLPDTPDRFGNDRAVAFGSAAQVMFAADGQFVDERGQPLNGSVFFGVPGQRETARAVTIFGPTGRVRGYRWTGSAWVR